jgi:CRISPR/Cas system CSM-associated protein Csm4 (group 5 of RAMP superfamily)
MEKLKESLENLRKELKNSKNIDNESLKDLQRLTSDIHNILKKNEKITVTGTPVLLNSLKQAAEKFELSHPELTGAINIVISSLTNIGI